MTLDVLFELEEQLDGLMLMWVDLDHCHYSLNHLKLSEVTKVTLKHTHIHTSQLNSMSDSIVLILTLKFLACFLLNEFNPILAAKALAMMSC